MRLLMINLLATALVLFSASFASAYELRLVGPGAGTNINPGDLIAYDIFLDTQAAVPSNIVLFSVSLEFDDSVLTYRQDLSDAEDYYPLYAPKVGKTIPATFLQPTADPFNLWPGTPLPSGNEAVQINFIETNLNPAQGTSTNEYLGTIVFEATGIGTSPNLFSFQTDALGNIFNVLGDDVSGSVSLVGGGDITVIPEPTTALLVGLGLVGLGAAGRRRA